MTYNFDFRRMVLAKQPELLLQRVFGYLNAMGGKPLAFGPFVAAALLGRKPLPRTIDILVDAGGAPLGMPNGWSRNPLTEPHKVKLGTYKLEAVGTCSVPNLCGHNVRLYRMNAAVTPLELAGLLELGAEQVVYALNDDRRPVFTDLFRQNLAHSVVTLARPEKLDKEAKHALQHRGAWLASVMGMRGVGIIRPKTTAKVPEKATAKVKEQTRTAAGYGATSPK